jgi:hypothetical protein
VEDPGTLPPMNENAIDEQPVREPNHLELARLVTEIA